MMSPIRFGIVGCGGAAMPVCQAMQRSTCATLALACDVDEALARDVGERFGVPFTTSADELFASPEVQAVYLAVPHDRLAPLARLALAAGKHALVEKPMALSLDEADSLIELAESRGLTLGVFYEMRYAGQVAQARALVQAGTIGRIVGVRIQTLIDKSPEYWRSGLDGRSVSPWRGFKARAGGGVTLMNTSHQLDALWHITGLEVARVSGEIGALAASVEVEDTASVALRFDNGAIGGLYAGAHLAGSLAAERMYIYGLEGQLVVPQLYEPSPVRLFVRRAREDYAAGEWHELPVVAADTYGGAVDGFARAVEAGQPAPIGGRDARRVLRTVLAMYQSAAEGRAVEIRRD